MIQKLEMDQFLVTPKRCALPRKWRALLSMQTWRRPRLRDPAGWKACLLHDAGKNRGC